MTSRLNAESLRYASTVAETGSFSEAARLHQVTQPALSNAIARLESVLGERLFERSTRGVTPTAFGDEILPLIDRAVRATDAVTASAQRLTTPTTGVIRLGVSPLISPKLVAAAFGAVRSAAPMQSELVLREATMDELVAGLRDGDLDVVLIPSVGPIPRHEHRIIDEEPIVVVGTPGGPSGPLELADVMDEQLILVPDVCGLTRFTHQLFEAHSRRPRAYAGEPTSYRVLEEWADLGLGVALLPLSKVATPEAHRPLVEDGTEVTIFYEAAWNPRSPAAGEIRDLVEAITALT